MKLLFYSSTFFLFYSSTLTTFLRAWSEHSVLLAQQLTILVYIYTCIIVSNLFSCVETNLRTMQICIAGSPWLLDAAARIRWSIRMQKINLLINCFKTMLRERHFYSGVFCLSQTEKTSGKSNDITRMRLHSWIKVDSIRHFNFDKWEINY